MNATFENFRGKGTARPSKTPDTVSKFRRVISAGILLLFAAWLPWSPALAGDCGASAAASVDWSGCNKRNLVLQYSDLDGANLSTADFALTDLSASNMAGTNLEKANLVRASLAGVNAAKANFSRVEAYRTNFSGLKASGASFVNSELQRSSFKGADLTGADFEKAEVGRVNFEEATMTGVRFALANLSRADLTKIEFAEPISFDRAFMFLTRIQGVDLSTATGLTQEQIDLACGDADTKLPPGLSASKSWPCMMD